MKSMLATMMLVFAVSLGAAADEAAAKPAEKAVPTVGKSLDRQLSIIEGDLTPLLAAMPEGKLDFVPQGPGFKGVRSFKQQVGHLAGALHVFAGIVLGEATAPPPEDESNGPARLKTKDDLTTYLKEAFAHAHKACLSVTEHNMLEPVSLAGGNFKSTKLGFANLLTWHSFDHYGQLVVYLRLNGIVPPSSR